MMKLDWKKILPYGIAIVAFVVIAISIIETATGCAIPLPEIAGGLNVLQGME